MATERDACGRLGCRSLANVTYRSTTDAPVPRCWDHAPPLPEAIAAGLMDPPCPAARTHPRPPIEPDTWGDWEPDQEAHELDAMERSFEREIGRT